MDQIRERWLPVVGWENSYEVSDQGRVRSLGRTRDGKVRQPCIMVLSPSGKNKKYRRVLLRNPDKWQLVHRLVLTAFVRPRHSNEECLHLNHCPEDNRLVNLRWGTKEENENAKASNGTVPIGCANPAAKLTEQDILAIREDTRKQVDIAAEYGIKQAHVSSIKLRKVWTHI